MVSNGFLDTLDTLDRDELALRALAAAKLVIDAWREFSPESQKQLINGSYAGAELALELDSLGRALAAIMGEREDDSE